MHAESGNISPYIWCTSEGASSHASEGVFQVQIALREVCLSLRLVSLSVDGPPLALVSVSRLSTLSLADVCLRGRLCGVAARLPISGYRILILTLRCCGLRCAGHAVTRASHGHTARATARARRDAPSPSCTDAGHAQPAAAPGPATAAQSAPRTRRDRAPRGAPPGTSEAAERAALHLQHSSLLLPVRDSVVRQDGHDSRPRGAT